MTWDYRLHWSFLDMRKVSGCSLILLACQNFEIFPSNACFFRHNFLAIYSLGIFLKSLSLDQVFQVLLCQTNYEYSLFPVSNYMFKVNNKKTRTRCEICSKRRSGVVLVSLLLTLNIFHTSFLCFYCWLWTCNCRLGYLFGLTRYNIFSECHYLLTEVWIRLTDIRKIFIIKKIYFLQSVFYKLDAYQKILK